MKKKYLKFTLTVVILLTILLYHKYSLSLFLMTNGYLPNGYTLHKDLTRDVPKAKSNGIYKVYTKDQAFQYLNLEQQTLGIWRILDESELCTSLVDYTSIYYVSDPMAEAYEDSFEVHYTYHSLFEIKKSTNDLILYLDRLTNDYKYDYVETTDSYIIDIYTNNSRKPYVTLEMFSNLSE